MAIKVGNTMTLISNLCPNLNKNQLRSCNNPLNNNKTQTPEEFIISVAANIASQPLQYSDPDVWAVLTAISDKARKRRQGLNMILNSDEHCIGRLVDDVRCQILSNQISADHCKISRKMVATEDMGSPSNFFLKDNSLNGTYLNWEKLNKHSPEAKLHHGDIISFAAPPHHELAYAFVFREVLKCTSLSGGSLLKRKAEEFSSGSKRQRGSSLGAPEGPISLDNFRSLQRSNMELRHQLEDQVTTIDALRSENRAANECHETGKEELIDSASISYADELKILKHVVEIKQKEVSELDRISAEQKHAMEDLNVRLGAAMLSCTESNEIIDSQKASIMKLEALLEEEQVLRSEERKKAGANLETSIQKVHAESLVEIKRLSDAYLRREKVQEDIIHKLQESDKQRSSLVEILKSKLEDTSKKLVNSEEKTRQLNVQICEEQRTSARGKERLEEFEQGIRRLRKELEVEKAAREETCAKVSALELQINEAMRDVDFERRKLKGAREKIMLRETQLRSFYSTTEEISILFAKQQEQLKTMQRALEDEENYDNISVDIDPSINHKSLNGSVVRLNEVLGHQNNPTAKADSCSSVQRRARNRVNMSSNEAGMTEKHDWDNKSDNNDQETQGAEFASEDRVVKGGFGSDIDGVGTAPLLEGDTVGTERVFETESAADDGDRHIDLKKLGEDTMQLNDDTFGPEADNCQMIGGGSSHHSQSSYTLEAGSAIEDTQRTIRTAELLASEVAGSWACNTAPSVHGENDSPRSKDYADVAAALLILHDSGLVAESQSAPSTQVAIIKCNQERQTLSATIGIVAPDIKDHFDGGLGSDCDQVDSEKAVASNSDKNTMDTEDDVASEAETENSEYEPTDEDDYATEPDSCG